eukprot:EG_transcript_15129
MSLSAVAMGPLEGMEDLGQFLPADADMGLRYLPLVGPSSVHCAVTKEQAELLARAKMWEAVNCWFLRVGLLACTLLAIAPAILGLRVVQDWENTTPANANLMFIITTLYSGAIGMINYVCTGTLPDRAAMTSIEAAACVQKTRDMYEAMGMALLAMCEIDPPQARHMAGALDPGNVTKALARHVPEATAADLCRPLLHARTAALEGRMASDAPAVLQLHWKLLQLSCERKGN